MMFNVVEPNPKVTQNLLENWENQLDLKRLKTKSKTNLHIINQIHNQLPFFKIKMDLTWIEIDHIKFFKTKNKDFS
jgi:hypothetical protein